MREVEILHQVICRLKCLRNHRKNNALNNAHLFMKQPIALTIAAMCGFALSSHAQILVNDTWADGNRTSSGPDGGGIDSPWYFSGTGASMTTTVGNLNAGVPTGSASWLNYFATDASPVNLANAGDSLKVTWNFTTGTIGAANTSQNFRLAILDSPSGSIVSSDTSPAAGIYSGGYAMFMNMAPTLGNGNPFQLKKRSVFTSSDQLSTSGNWGTALGNGATTGNSGYANATAYSYTLTLTRNASSGIDIVSTMAGGTLNGSGTATVSATDAAPGTFTFDTFSIRPSGSASTADAFNFTQYQVEFTPAPVPEPSILALSGLGLAALAGYRRLRK